MSFVALHVSDTIVYLSSYVSFLLKSGALRLIEPHLLGTPSFVGALVGDNVHTFGSCVELHRNLLGRLSNPQVANVLDVLDVPEVNVHIV